MRDVYCANCDQEERHSSPQAQYKVIENKTQRYKRRTQQFPVRVKEVAT